MKFGYFCNTTNWKHKPYKQLLDEARDISVFCDENNWDSIWFTEHHFNHEGMESCTNPLMMGTDIAARTKNIKIGQACNVITFHNPIRLAEDIAFLDQLSEGRVEVGIGRGVYGREAINMNKEADLKDQAKNFRLFEETLTIMKKAWTEKFFNHQGEFYTYPAPNFKWQHDMSPPSEEFLDMNPDSEADGYYGINIHKAGGYSRNVEKYSAGCQVFAFEKEYDVFISLCELSAHIWGNAFTYTLLED